MTYAQSSLVRFNWVETIYICYCGNVCFATFSGSEQSRVINNVLPWCNLTLRLMRWKIMKTSLNTKSFLFSSRENWWRSVLQKFGDGAWLIYLQYQKRRGELTSNALDAIFTESKILELYRDLLLTVTSIPELSKLKQLRFDIYLDNMNAVIQEIEDFLNLTEEEVEAFPNVQTKSLLLATSKVPSTSAASNVHQD